jgi:hypothetical protein
MSRHLWRKLRRCLFMLDSCLRRNDKIEIDIMTLYEGV